MSDGVGCRIPFRGDPRTSCGLDRLKAYKNKKIIQENHCDEFILLDGVLSAGLQKF
jgi:hypothetical protein